MRMMLRKLTPKAFYREDFNRADETMHNVSGNWYNVYGLSARVFSNAGTAGVVSASTGRQGAGWMTNQQQGVSPYGPFLTDNFFVRAQLKAPPGNLATDNWTALYLGAMDAFTSGRQVVLLMATGTTTATRCKLMIMQGAPNGPGNSAPTTTAGNNVLLTTAASNMAVTDLMEVQRNGTNITVLKNGVSFMTATNSTFFTGASYRRWGISFEANYPFAQSQYSSPAIDWVEAGDL